MAFSPDKLLKTLDLENQGLAACQFKISRDSPIIDQTIRKIPLKFHQLAAVYQMQMIEKTTYVVGNYEINHRVAVLNLPPGAGKTYSILEHIFANKISFPSKLTYTSNGLFLTIPQSPVLNISIIVAAENSYQSWVTHLNQYISNDMFKCIFTKKDILQNNLFIKLAPAPDANGKLHKKKPILNYSNVESTTSILLIKNTLLSQIDFSQKKISRLVLDEIDSLQISNNCNINPVFTWLLSSTYECSKNFSFKWLLNLTKGPRDVFHSILSDSHKPYCCIPCITCPTNIFISEFNLPKLQITKYKYSGFPLWFVEFYDNFLADMISKNAFNRLSELFNINLTSYTDSVLKTKNKLQKIYTQLLLDNAENTELEAITTQINSLEERSIKIICCICDENINPFLLPCCRQTICNECLFKTVINGLACPLCRKSLEIILTHLYETTQYLVPSIATILKGLFQKLSTDSNSRILVSLPKYMIEDNFLEFVLDDLNLSYLKLNYNSKMDDLAIIDFESKSIRVVCIEHSNLKTFQNVTDLITIDYFTNQSITKKIGQAYRPGRIAPLQVHILTKSEQDNI